MIQKENSYGDNDNLKITNYDHLKFTKNGKF